MVKHKKVTKRVGEYLGPVDWDYDFYQHFENYGGSKKAKKEKCINKKKMLKTIEKNPDKYEISTYPHVWKKVHKVGMWDGWPYWRPVPAVKVYDSIANTYTWKHFYEIKHIRKIEDN